MARRKEGQVTAGAVGPKTREDSSVWLCLTRSAFKHHTLDALYLYLSRLLTVSSANALSP